MGILPDFCTRCGTLLPFPTSSLVVACDLCHLPVKLTDSQEKKTSEIRFNVRDETQKVEQERATIKEECPNCKHDTLYFWTMQTRSVDEGQTVFYECVQCKHKWSIFN